VIYNDYGAVENRKGFPEGHPSLIRELTVPVIRANRCVAILGVGNKAVFYNEMQNPSRWIRGAPPPLA